MVKLESPSLQALARVIMGEAYRGQHSPSVSRTGKLLMEFFRMLSFEADTYPFPHASKKEYVIAKLEEANGKEIVSKIIASAVDPRDYLGTEHGVQRVVDYLNGYFDHDGFKIVPAGKRYTVVPVGQFGVNSAGDIKNLIFASNGPKPEIVLDDALSNSIRIVANEKYCLIYTRPVSERGLWWSDLVTWAKEECNLAEERLLERLRISLNVGPEQLLFNTYYAYAQQRFGNDFPALLPQVYFHFDPKTLKQLNGSKRIPRQRMDFLLLLPYNVRVVLEVDGRQHYSLKNGQADSQLYAEMVMEDRKLKLSGHEVYRFGGTELTNQNSARQMLSQFFGSLFEKHNVQRDSVAKSRVVEPTDDLPF